MYRGNNKTDAGRRTSSKKAGPESKVDGAAKTNLYAEDGAVARTDCPSSVVFVAVALLLLLLLVYAAKMRNFVLWALAKWLCPFVCLSVSLLDLLLYAQVLKRR